MANKKNRKVPSQSWEPGGWLKLLKGIWTVVLSAAKVAVGAVATVLCILIVCGVVFVGLLGNYLEEDILPNADLALENFDLDQTSFIYAVNSTGEIEMIQQINADTDRQWASLDEIPEDLIHAVVAIEDKRFYEHQGVDWITTVKACVNMFFGGSTQFGGSTITQQLIKNILLTEDATADDVTVQRKVLEIFRAQQFEKNYDKDVIMEWYLNTIYLGERCAGVKSAAAEYFGKDLGDLTLAECASLIGITKNPSKYDPYLSASSEGEPTGADRNRERQLDVLDKMLAQGWITDEEYEEAVNQTMVFQRGVVSADSGAACSNANCGFTGTVSELNKEDGVYYCPECGYEVTDIEEKSSGVYSWFVEAVLDDVAEALAEHDGVEWNDATKATYLQLIKRGGYHIYTTMDMDVQAQVDEIYTDLSKIPTAQSAKQLQSAIIVIDNSTGDIVAMAGGVGEKVVWDATNRATESTLQTGSSIKPLSVYAPAFESGAITPATVVKDLPQTYTDDVPFPNNDNKVYQFSRTILAGVTASVNTIAVHTMEAIGLQYGYEYATEKFRLSTLTDYYVNDAGKVYSDVNYSPLALGSLTKGATVRDMTNAYATFANNGVYREGRTFTKVYNSKGELVLDNVQETEQILSQKTVDYMNYCLVNAVQNGTGTSGKLTGITVASKTGSTTSYKDRWFCGYTGYYTAAVWCGYDQPEAIKLTGSNTSNPAGRLWKMVMEPLHQGKEDIPLYNEKKMVKVTVCLDCGKLATEACELDVRSGTVSRTSTAKVYPEDIPEETCDCHVTVDYCVTGGGVANEYCLKFAEAGVAEVTQRALVKMTQSVIEEMKAASGKGLQSVYLRDDYIYLVDAQGNDLNFRGIYGTANAGINAPYVACTAHTEAAWNAYCQQHPEVEDPTEGDDNTWPDFEWPWG